MISIIKQNDDTAYNVKEFIADTAADLTELPTDCAIGSTCFVIADSAVYMLNGSKEWKEIRGAI